MRSSDEPGRWVQMKGLGRRAFLVAAGAMGGVFTNGCRPRNVTGQKPMQTSSPTARPSIVRPRIGYDGRGFGLEWSGARLAQVFAGGIRLWDRASWKVLREVPIRALNAFGALADESLILVMKGAEDVEVIHIPTAGELRHYRARWLLGQGRHAFLPSRVSPRQFFLLDTDHRGAVLWELPQKRGLVRELDPILFPVSAQDSVLSLGDGSFVYNELGTLHRIGPVPPRGEVPKRALTWPLAHARFLTRGPSEQTLWAAELDGAVSLVELTDKGEARVERTLKVPGQIYQLESAKDAVAILHVDPPWPGEEKWTLVVLDIHGKQRMSASLPTEPLASPLATPPRNRCLRMTDDYVVVGGPSEITVWQISSGRVVHRHSAAPPPH